MDCPLHVTIDTEIRVQRLPMLAITLLKDCVVLHRPWTASNLVLSKYCKILHLIGSATLSSSRTHLYGGLSSRRNG